MLKIPPLFDKKNPKQIWVIALSAIILFFPLLGSVHLFDWDEINFAESAREMLLTSHYTVVQINFQPFWEKPPLFFWLQVMSMKVFGINEFAARFPNAVFGVITLITLYLIGKRLHDGRMGFIWAIIYLGSFLPHLYFKSGIIDPVFNFFIFLSVVFLYRSVGRYPHASATKFAILAGLFSGLAVLTKGPVGFLILLLCFLSYWAWHGFRKVSNFKNIGLFALTFAAISFFWFGLETIKNGPWFLLEFIKYQIRLFSTPDAGHQQPFFYHFVVVLIGCFPLSVYALPSFIKEYFKERADFRHWMLCLFWVVMILFTIVETKIVHYSSMAYLPLSYLAARYIYHLINTKSTFKKGMNRVLVTVGSIFSVLLMAVPQIILHKEKIIPYIKDDFAVASLNTHIHWTGWESLIGLAFLVFVWMGYLLIKRGKLALGVFYLSYATAFTLLLYMIVVVPKIEGHSQGPAIRFYESLQGQDVYVATLGFKSYAHYFYSQKPNSGHEQSNDTEWLLSGEIDKEAYFVTKVNKQDRVKKYEDVHLIGTEGGFAFFKRAIPMSADTLSGHQ